MTIGRRRRRILDRLFAVIDLVTSILDFIAMLLCLALLVVSCLYAMAWFIHAF